MSNRIELSLHHNDCINNSCEASCDCDVPERREDSEEELSIVADREERDRRSIFISNIDVNTTKEDIEEHFSPCGKIASVVITKVKGSNIKRKVFLEFEDISSVDNGLMLNESQLHGRTLRVLPKRTNVRGFAPRPPRATMPMQYMPNMHQMHNIPNMYMQPMPYSHSMPWTQWPNQQWQTQWPGAQQQSNQRGHHWQTQQSEWINYYRK